MYNAYVFGCCSSTELCGIKGCYDSSLPGDPNADITKNSKKSSLTIGEIILIALGAAILCLIIFMFIYR